MRDDAPIVRSASTWRVRSRPMSRQRVAVVDAVVRRVLGAGCARPAVAVDGPTASGKSHFADDVAQRLANRGRPVLLAGLDDFKRPWRDAQRDDRLSPEGYYRNAYDYDSLRTLLLDPFAGGDPEGCALCAVDPLTQVSHRDDRVPVPVDAVLVVEGVFAFRPEIDRHWDVRVWLQVPAEESIRRCAERDRSWAGDDAGRLVRERYLPSERLYEAEVGPRDRADVVVVDNTRIDDPIVLG